jgi:hypothetical protein
MPEKIGDDFQDRLCADGVKIVQDKHERRVLTCDLVDDDVQQGLERGWLQTLEDADQIYLKGGKDFMEGR